MNSARRQVPSLRVVAGTSANGLSAAETSTRNYGGAMALILIVDDSPTEVHVMKTALEKHGYQIASASDGAEAIAKAKSMKPDLIFMDVVMPGVNGFQATRKLTADPETRSIPVIMVTSKDQESDRVWGMRQGAVDYLVKPVSPDELIEKAQAALAS
jgi:twitching motility two-component system response regulator PilH